MSELARWSLAIVTLCAQTLKPAWGQAGAPPGKPALEPIRISRDGRRVALSGSGAEFRPGGFNYDHDASNGLLETYWKDDSNAVVGDSREMKQLGANTVRMHLQVSRLRL